MLSSKVFVADKPKDCKVYCECAQRHLEQLGELFWVLAFFHNWHDSADAFEGVETEANHVPHLGGIYHLESIILWAFLDETNDGVEHYEKCGKGDHCNAQGETGFEDRESSYPGNW